MRSKASKLISYIYLLLVPFIGAALAFGIGHISYKIYLPLWLLNVVLMMTACWSLGLHLIRSKIEEESRFVKTVFFLIIPMIITSLFAGMGPPPDNAKEWTATAQEQQVRYFLLVVSGVFVAFGFVGLKNILYTGGEKFYSQIASTAILIAIPLLIINMLYWGFYLTELFKIQVDNNSSLLPEWHLPVRKLFGLISVTEVALTYFGTFAIVLAMKRTGWIGKTSGFFYVLFSLLAFVIIILSAFFAKTLEIPGFAVSIPAVPFIIPYFIAVNLLRQAANRDLAIHSDLVSAHKKL